MSQVDQKRAFNKLKHDLEPFRNLIVHTDSLLTWEKNYYPAVIAAAVSVFFFILYLMDFSTVTTFSVGGLVLLSLDSLYPTVSRMLFNNENWSGNQEAQFERVCTQLCNIKMTLTAWYEYLFTTKEKKSTMFVIVMSVTLIALAWLGAIFNNLLLMYILTLSVAMYPGVQEQNVFGQVKEKFGGVVNSKIQQIREKGKKNE